MGKRSQFERQPRDLYPTPAKGVEPLIPHLHGVRTFAEPCVGNGDLARHLHAHDLTCVLASDLSDGIDARDIRDFRGADAIITNPPWSRDVLHDLIQHFQSYAPTWLLLDADWAHTIQAAPFIDQCSHIVAVGRLKWIPDSPYTGKDNCAWYRFHAQHVGGPRFFPREVRAAA